MLFVGLAFSGLVVLAVCAAQVFFAVRGFGRELRRTRRALEPKHSALVLAARSLDRARE